MDSDKLTSRMSRVSEKFFPSGSMDGLSREGLFPVEPFIDLSNINTSFHVRGDIKTDYGELINAVGRRLAKRLGITFVSTFSNAKQLAKAIRQPVAFCWNVWCVACIPVNYNPADEKAVREYRGFLTALRLRHGFNVEEIKLDFHGYHIRQFDRSISHSQAERFWRRQEKCVDVSLAVRIVQRCLSGNPPSGVVVMSGDADFAPVLREVTRRVPSIVAMVASFKDTLSGIYRSGNLRGFSWRFPPILLDECLDELNSHKLMNSA
jgi:hypothetical protein